MQRNKLKEELVNTGCFQSIKVSSLQPLLLPSSNNPLTDLVIFSLILISLKPLSVEMDIVVGLMDIVFDSGYSPPNLIKFFGRELTEND